MKKQQRIIFAQAIRSKKQEQDINRLNERIDDSENVEAIQLGIIARLQAENNELRAEIERLKTENLTQGFECVGVSAI